MIRCYVSLFVLMIFLAGCSSDERLITLSREAANRQAQQNQEMARVNRSVAEGTNHLIEEHAQSRKDLAELQGTVQAQQSEIHRQRDALETERRSIADQRLTESRLGPVLSSLGILALGVTTLCFCSYLVIRLVPSNEDPLGELLLEDLVSEEPKLFPNPLGTLPTGHLTETSPHSLEEKEEPT